MPPWVQSGKPTRNRQNARTPEAIIFFGASLGNKSTIPLTTVSKKASWVSMATEASIKKKIKAQICGNGS